MATVRLMEFEWSENPHEVDYYLPDGWDVTVCHIAGYSKPVLTIEQIKAAIASPIGSPRIRDIAKGKKKVCILFDDMTRGTPTYKLVPLVLAELKEAGITDDQIEFICENGAHQAWDKVSLTRKIGADIIARYPVHNHCPFMNTTPLGKTSFGTRVEVNTEVMSCDLKIAVSNIVPHPNYGFGGGGKCVMPGVSSYESIAEHHGIIHRGFRQAITVDGKGVWDGNPQPQDAYEFAEMAGIDFQINCMLNEVADVTNIFAGAVVAAHEVAVKEAKAHYRCDPPLDSDIIISNAYCKANEAFIASASAFLALSAGGGSAVTIANSPLGQVVHYLTGTHGRSIAGRNPGRLNIPDWVSHCLWYTEFPEAKTLERVPEKVRPKFLMTDKWAEVITRLVEWHGAKARVAVFPDGTNMYIPQPLKKAP